MQEKDERKKNERNTINIAINEQRIQKTHEKKHESIIEKKKT